MRSPRARVRAIAVAALVLAALAVRWGKPAGAAGRTRRDRRWHRGIVIVQVNGLLDPPNAALITKSLRDAERARASLVAFQLSASGAVDVNVATADPGDRDVRRCPSRCGSGRRAVKRAVRARCSRSRRRTSRLRPARTSARSFRSTSVIRTRPGHERSAESVGGPPEPMSTQSSSSACRAPDAVDRQADRRHRADRRSVHCRVERQGALDGDRRRPHVGRRRSSGSARTARSRRTRTSAFASSISPSNSRTRSARRGLRISCSSPGSR